MCSSAVGRSIRVPSSRVMAIRSTFSWLVGDCKAVACTVLVQCFEMSDHLPIGPLSLSFFVQVQIEEHQGRGDPSTSRALGSGSRMGLPWQFGKQARVQTRLDLRGREHTQSFCPRCSFKSRISLTTTSRDKATLSSCKSDR